MVLAFKCNTYVVHKLQKSLKANSKNDRITGEKQSTNNKHPNTELWKNCIKILKLKTKNEVKNTTEKSVILV